MAEFTGCPGRADAPTIVACRRLCSVLASFTKLRPKCRMWVQSVFGFAAGLSNWWILATPFVPVSISRGVSRQLLGPVPTSGGCESSCSPTRQFSEPPKSIQPLKSVPDAVRNCNSPLAARSKRPVSLPKRSALLPGIRAVNPLPAPFLSSTVPLAESELSVKDAARAVPTTANRTERPSTAPERQRVTNLPDNKGKSNWRCLGTELTARLCTIKDLRIWFRRDMRLLGLKSAKCFL